jgi:hypothetical protein
VMASRAFAVSLALRMPPPLWDATFLMFVAS